MNEQQLISMVEEQENSLLDSQLSNLSQRLFETGRKADQQLTTWLTFAALTILLCFGTAESVSIGGLQLKAKVAGAVTYGLSCLFYYRAVLSIKAAEVWREAFKERRRTRFNILLEYSQQQGPASELMTNRNVKEFVPEYPGYLACSVQVRDEALRSNKVIGKFIARVHELVIGAFSVSPYVLAASLLYATWLSKLYLAIAVAGVITTLSANVVMRHDASA